MDSQEFTRNKTYGFIQRFLHWWIGILVTALVAMGWVEKIMEPGVAKLGLHQIHLTLGYGLALGVGMRFFWSLLGPSEARITKFWHPREWRILVLGRQIQNDEGFGHNPRASIAYLFLYANLLVVIGTGLVLAGIRYDVGPFAELLFDDFNRHAIYRMMHESILYSTTGFILVHIGGMILHERRTGVPVAQSMVSGYQYRGMKEGGKS